MMACASRAGLEKQSSWLPGICTSRGGFHLPVRASEPWCVERYGIVEGLDVSDSRAKDNDTLIEEQEEEDADVTDIIGGDIQNKEEG